MIADVSEEAIGPWAVASGFGTAAFVGVGVETGAGVAAGVCVGTGIGDGLADGSAPVHPSSGIAKANKQVSNRNPLMTEA